MPRCNLDKILDITVADTTIVRQTSGMAAPMLHLYPLSLAHAVACCHADFDVGNACTAPPLSCLSQASLADCYRQCFVRTTGRLL